jgi:uncharacterized protein YutE (UPF0331/DUF86 family)
MTRGSISLKIVHEKLLLIESCLGELRKLPVETLADFTADHRAAAAESYLRRALQAIFDLLRHLIAKGYGRGLLEYRELARIAREEKLVEDPELGEILDRMARYRNRMTHFYDEITDDELYEIVKTKLGDLEGIARELQRSASRLSQG